MKQKVRAAFDLYFRVHFSSLVNMVSVCDTEGQVNLFSISTAFPEVLGTWKDRFRDTALKLRDNSNESEDHYCLRLLETMKHKALKTNGQNEMKSFSCRMCECQSIF